MTMLKDKLLQLAGQFDNLDSTAILIAFIAGLVTGWIWYAFAGRVWKTSVSPASGVHSPRRYIFSAIAQIIMTVFLLMVVKRLGEASTAGGISTAFTIWLGFVMPAVLVNYANLGQRLTLTFIDGIHWLLVLVVMGAIIGTLITAQPAAPVAPAATTAPSVSGTTTGG